MSACLAGCSLFVDLSGFSNGAIDRDAGVVESGASRDAANAAESGEQDDARPTREASLNSDAGTPNLHPFGSFDTGCGPWKGFHATVVGVQDGHLNPGSCRVCTDLGITDNFSADDFGAIAGPVVGATYRAEAWVSYASGANGTAEIGILMRTFNSSPTFAEVDKNQSGAIVSGSVWTKIETTLKVTSAAEKLNIVIVAPATPGACFLVDDVFVERIK